jgi:hypothetical protein
MTVEKITLIKRTVYVSECKCGERDVKDSAPPRERFCKCGEWVPYKAESYTGPDL